MTDKNTPYYRLHMFCCTNVRPDGHPRGCCSGRGSVTFRNYLKARGKELGLDDIRVNTAGCLDRCELGATVVIYPEAVWYTYIDEDDVDEIIDSHLVNGIPVERLRI